jgi:hypothetical protein
LEGVSGDVAGALSVLGARGLRVEKERWLGLRGATEFPGSLREAGNNRLFLLKSNPRVYMSIYEHTTF